MLDSTLDADVRKIIIQKRKKYLDSCRSIGLELIIDEKEIEEYLYYKDVFDKVLNSTILECSFFGRGIIKKLKKANIDFGGPLDAVASKLVFLDKNNLAITTRAKTRQNKYQTMFSMPVLANVLSKKNLDSTLIHELIHISEINTDNKYQGLLFNTKYNFFSEIRTAGKEKELFAKLRQDHIYILDQDNSLNEPSLFYYNFISLIKPILDDYKDLFNYCAITNKIAPIYKNLGRENFDGLCGELSTLYDKIMLMYDISPELLENMNIINMEPYEDYMNKFKTYRKIK